MPTAYAMTILATRPSNGLKCISSTRSVAVALAAGKLMKLPPDRLAQAVNLALNDHIPMGQTRTQTVSDWKGIADAEAGRNGVFAATLARGGLTGPAPIFEGRLGFFKLIA